MNERLSCYSIARGRHIVGRRAFLEIESNSKTAQGQSRLPIQGFQTGSNATSTTALTSSLSTLPSIDQKMSGHRHTYYLLTDDFPDHCTVREVPEWGNQFGGINHLRIRPTYSSLSCRSHLYSLRHKQLNISELTWWLRKSPGRWSLRDLCVKKTGTRSVKCAWKIHRQSAYLSIY